MTQLNPQETANEQKVAHQEVEIQEMATGQEEASENQAAVGNQEERDGQEAEAQYEAKTPEPEVVTWGRISDLRLLVNEKTPEGPVPKVFAVSSHAISMACDAWYSMLNGGFKEAQQQSSAVREVALPEDDTEALTVLLDIAHLRFDRVPLQLEFELLLKITVLTDKYAATRLVKPWAYRWIERCEYYAGCKAQWLWVAWELGHVGIFADIVRTLVMTVSVGPEGECVNEDGSILDPKSSSQHLPPDIIESIMDVRQAIVKKLLNVYYSRLEAIVDRNTAGQTFCLGSYPDYSVNREECDNLVYGSLSIALKKAGLGGERTQSAAPVTISIAALVSKLSLVKSRIYHTERCCNHDISERLWAEVAAIKGAIPLPLLRSHWIHLRRQADALGFPFGQRHMSTTPQTSTTQHRLPM
ncbi:hypothetical protein IWZ00DRAFT_491286 [Phyllosticta capitalensis]